MRYELSENIAIGGILPTGVNVTIEVIDMLSDTPVVLSSNACTESIHINGLYVWTTDNITTAPNGYSVMFYRMSDGTNNVQGKFVYGGYVNDQIDSTALIDGKMDNIDAKVWAYIIP